MTSDPNDVYAVRAELEAAQQEIARLRYELKEDRDALAGLQRRYEIRKAEGLKAEQAFAALFFDVTHADAMPSDFEVALVEAKEALGRMGR